MKIESITGGSAMAYAENPASAQKNAAKSPQDYGIADMRVSSNITLKQIQEEKEKDESNENKDGQASEKQIINAISQANQKIKRVDGTSLEFSYHEATQRVSIQVVDKNTREIIREIPPEKSLDMLQKMWELAGILVDERR